MFLLFLTFASGRQQTLTFPTAFARGLYIIALANQPVGLRSEDV